MSRILNSYYTCQELICFLMLVMFAIVGYEPKIRFLRTGTIAEGAVCCDFRFIDGKQ